MSLTKILSAKYMLGRMRTGTPTMGYRMKDKEQAIAVEEGAAIDAFSVRTRNLYADCPSLIAPSKIISACRSWFDNANPPWTQKQNGRREAGSRLVATETLMDTIEHFGFMKQQFKDTLAAIDQAVFDEEIARAKDRAGHQAESINWPTMDEFKERYLLDLQVDPLPAFNADVALPGDVVEGLERLYDRRERALAESAFEDRKDRLLDSLRTLHHALRPDGVIKNSTYDRPAQLVADDALGFMIGVLGKDQLGYKRLANQLKLDLGEDREKIRKDPQLREDLRTALQLHITAVEAW